VGFGSVKTKGRPVSVMAHLKRSIIEVKAVENCLAHALVIAIAKVRKDPNYNSYRRGLKIYPAVNALFRETGIDLRNGGGIPELTRFQEHFLEYRIFVHSGLNCDNIMFYGQVESNVRVNLLYDDVKRHFHVITNLIGAMAQRYICNGCNKGCKRGVTHKCDVTCSGCTSVPPCVPDADRRIPCDQCNRHFRRRICFNNHKILRPAGTRLTVCESRRCCAKCGALVTDLKHECHKIFCKNRKRNREIGHLCYMAPLQNKPRPSQKVLYVFYDFETTQDTRFTQTATRHVPNLVCVQQFCSMCDNQPDANIDCVRYGKRTHSFWEDPVGDMLAYLCEPRPWADNVIAIARNAKTFDLHFILSRAIMLKWQPELIMNGVKIMCMKVEHTYHVPRQPKLPPVSSTQIA
jgi:hypothetical protein